MLTASFPPGNLSFLAWLALVPLLKGLDNISGSGSFKLGFIAGLTHYLTLMYWIVVVLGHYGNLHLLPSFGIFLLMCAYLALYPAVFAFLVGILKGSRLDLILMASFWVALEYARARLLTGFPWCILGYTQFSHLYLIQIADLAGVYGPSFLIVSLNGLIYRILFTHNGRRNRFLKWEISIAVLLIGFTLGYGHYRLSENPRGKQPRPHINTLIVQANIDQSLKWNPAYQKETVATYQRLTRTATNASGHRLIVWPETCMPFFFQDNKRFSPEIYALAKQSGTPLILGSPAYKRTGRMTKYYNRAFLITPDGMPPQFYDKVHLVPFGEYVPLKQVLSFVNRLVPAAGDFEPGDRIVPLNHDNLSMGILICFEAIFPEHARAHVMKGANILVNLTNDAWFGMTSAPYQHLSMTIFRAVENRRPLIRAANTGFSAAIGAAGDIRAISPLFHEWVLSVPLEMPAPSLTLYARFGDMFAICLVVISLIKILACLWYKRSTD